LADHLPRCCHLGFGHFWGRMSSSTHPYLTRPSIVIPTQSITSHQFIFFVNGSHCTDVCLARGHLLPGKQSIVQSHRKSITMGSMVTELDTAPAFHSRGRIGRKSFGTMGSSIFSSQSGGERLLTEANPRTLKALHLCDICLPGVLVKC
jgi:hypothetical protein